MKKAYQRSIGWVALLAVPVALLVVAGIVSGGSPERAPTPQTFTDQAVPMRDGVRLSANVTVPGKGRRYPTILVRTPYSKASPSFNAYAYFVERGYAVVIQDLRGRFQSQGRFAGPNQEIDDGDDSLNWIAAQPWSDGNIGMMGGSYLGIAQYKAALSGNPHLKAICPVVAGSDDYFDRYYSRGGAFKLGHRLEWFAENMRLPGRAKADFSQFVRHLPLRTADRAATGQTVPLFQEALNHPIYDEYWRKQSTRVAIDKINVPVLITAGWYDNYGQSDLETFSALQENEPRHRIVIGAWPHNMSMKFANVDFGPDVLAPVRRYQLEWLNQHLRPNMPKSQASLLSAPVRMFVMGINQWRDEQEWPLRRARPTPLYLAGDGAANSLSGRGSLNTRAGHGRPDRFNYDPRNPVPTRGGAVCCNPVVFPWGPLDQRAVEQRPDVLVYTGPPLSSDLEVTGSIRANLYVATSAADTDFTAKLVDVFPSGEARNLTDGILRMRYFRGVEVAEPIQRNRIYAIDIDMGVTSNVFRVGHRVRLEVSSSNFPRFDRNLNLGTSQADETRTAIASQTIYHDRKRPSQLVLPVVPPG